MMMHGITNRGSATKGTVPHRASRFWSVPSPCSRFGMSFLSDIVMRDWDSHSCGLLSLSEQSPSPVIMFIRVHNHDIQHVCLEQPYSGPIFA